MAEKPKEKKEGEKKHSGGEISFGLEVLIFVVAVFLIWILTGGIKKPVEDKPFITPLSDPINPGLKYGPGDLNNNYQQIPTQYNYSPTDKIN